MGTRNMKTIEEKRAYLKKWRQANKEKVREYNRKWKKENQEKTEKKEKKKADLKEAGNCVKVFWKKIFFVSFFPHFP